MFSRTRKQSDSSGSDQIIANEDGHKADIDLSGSTLDEAYENRGFDVSDGLIEESMDETVEVENQVAATEEAELKIEDSIVKPTLMGLYDGNQRDYSMDDLCNFSHFDVTENPLDHHFHGDAEMVIDKFLFHFLATRQIFIELIIHTMHMIFMLHLNSAVT